MAAIVIQWVVVWRRHLALSSPEAVKSLQWSADGRWELFGTDGAKRSARLLPAAYVHPWLVVLKFITEDKRRCAVVLPADGLSADEHRRLRVRLGLNQTPAA